MLHQPNPEEKPNFIEGLKAIRKMHIDAIAQTPNLLLYDILTLNFLKKWLFLLL